MEFAAGGDLFTRVRNNNGMSESEARWFFQQLIIGLDYAHKVRPFHTNEWMNMCAVCRSLWDCKQACVDIPATAQGALPMEAFLENSCASQEDEALNIPGLLGVSFILFEGPLYCPSQIRGLSSLHLPVLLGQAIGLLLCVACHRQHWQCCWAASALRPRNGQAPG